MPRLLIDTNVLLLHVVGSHDRTLIERLKRTATFTQADFDLLQEELHRYSDLVVTPSILTELSNLLPNWAHELVAQSMRHILTPFQEEGAPFAEVMADPVFPRLGFTDTAITTVAFPGADENNLHVLTDDVHLYNELAYRGVNVINFNHLRSSRMID